MATAQESSRTQLFTLRVWTEAVGADRVEIRGTLTHALSGETYHFRNWERLTQLIESHIATAQTSTVGEIS